MRRLQARLDLLHAATAEKIEERTVVDEAKTQQMVRECRAAIDAAHGGHQPHPPQVTHPTHTSAARTVAGDGRCNS